jgi:8-oxo-dGTP pyrophosphatase MutT (NUDIX family)
MNEITTVVPVERLDLAFAPRPWPFADERRAEIAAHFAALRKVNPTLWNGRVLLLHRYSISASVFHGSYLETDYASLLAWRHWDFPDRQMRNCFGMAALRAADGAFLLGVMAAHTANAGLVYFPAGVPDQHDIVGTRVDLAENVLREIGEETGLCAGDFEAEHGWTTVLAGPRIAQIRLFQMHESAETVRQRIFAYLKTQPQPELADLRVVRGPAELDAAMPPFVTEYLTHLWNRK